MNITALAFFPNHYALAANREHITLTFFVVVVVAKKPGEIQQFSLQ